MTAAMLPIALALLAQQPQPAQQLQQRDAGQAPAPAIAPAQPAPPPRLAPVKQASATGDTKLVCKVYARTGSLIARQRVCMTRSEWQRQINEAQDQLHEMRPGYREGQ